MENLQSIGAAVRRARSDAGLTQVELARAAGVNRYTIIRLEGGKLADMSYKTLAAIVDALGFELTVVEKRLTGLPVLGDKS